MTTTATTTATPAPAAVTITWDGTRYTTSDGRTETGPRTYTVVAEVEHRGSTIVVHYVSAFIGDHCAQRSHLEVSVDGRSFRCPVGTVDQVVAKVRKAIDVDRADAAILNRLTALVGNVDCPVRLDASSTVGDVVSVYAMGYYRRGLVVRVTATKVEVAYTTASSGGRVYRKLTAAVHDAY